MAAGHGDSSAPGPGAQGQQRSRAGGSPGGSPGGTGTAAPLGRAAMEGREVGAVPPLPSARQSPAVNREVPGHRCGFAFQTQVECQTRVPWFFRGAQAPSPHSPQSFALPSPVTLYLLPLLTACFLTSPQVFHFFFLLLFMYIPSYFLPLFFLVLAVYGQ